MLLDDRRILVGGANGLAGSAVVRSLLETSGSARVRAVFRHRHGCFVDDPRVEYVAADLTRREDCRRVAEGCHAAVLAAANTGGAGAAREQPWTQVTDNVVMDALLLEAVALAGVSRIVYVGTASAYQEFEGFIREDELDWNQDPHSAYFGVGWAKRYAEKLCRFWHDTKGLEVAIVRAANLYGPFSRFDPAWSHFVAALVRKAVEEQDPFEVWGAPEVARDIIHADDFARAVVAMLELPDLGFEVFNVGSGHSTTVKQVVEWSLAFAGHVPRTLEYRSDRPTTIGFRGLDIAWARERLGWAPRISPEEGIRRTLEWWRENRSRWTR